MNKIIAIIYLTITFPLVYFYNAAVSINNTLDELKKEYTRLVNEGSILCEVEK